MAAIRLGSALSSLTGTSKQLLRVNTGETGFEFFSPASIPAYTVSNVTTDRVFDANDVIIDKLADVVGTLIADLTSVINGSGLTAFQWSASEQVWPFEKPSTGETLYCKEVDCGYAPNAGAKYIAHNIANFNPGDMVYRVEGRRRVDSSYYLPMPGNATVSDYNITFGVSGANIFLFTSIDYSSNQVVLRMVYKKQ